MPFVVVSGVGPQMGVLDRGGYHWRGRDSFGGECGASHCNQWGLCCIVVSKCMNWSSCHLAWWLCGPRHWCKERGPRDSKGKGEFCGRLPHWPNNFNGLIFKRNVLDLCMTKLRIFPYAQYITGIYVSLAPKCTQVRGRCLGLRVICKNVTVTSGTDYLKQQRKQQGFMWWGGLVIIILSQDKN